MATNEHEAARQERLGVFGEVDDLGYVGQVVARETHRVRPPALQHGEIVLMRLDLKVDQPNVVAGLSRRRGNQLEAQRLETEVDAGVHQSTGMNSEEPHEVILSILRILGRLGSVRNGCPGRSCRQAPQLSPYVR